VKAGQSGDSGLHRVALALLLALGSHDAVSSWQARSRALVGTGRPSTCAGQSQKCLRVCISLGLSFLVLPLTLHRHRHRHRGLSQPRLPAFRTAPSSCRGHNVALCRTGLCQRRVWPNAGSLFSGPGLTTRADLFGVVFRVGFCAGERPRGTCHAARRISGWRWRTRWRRTTASVRQADFAVDQPLTNTRPPCALRPHAGHPHACPYAPRALLRKRLAD
jgi:hypothetical protein